MSAQTLNSAYLLDADEVLAQVEKTLLHAAMAERELARYGSLYSAWVDVLRARGSIKNLAISLSVEEQQAQEKAA